MKSLKPKGLKLMVSKYIDYNFILEHDILIRYISFRESDLGRYIIFSSKNNTLRIVTYTFSATVERTIKLNTYIYDIEP